jgi:DcuC family C4-dicarboxylate transporter
VGVDVVVEVLVVVVALGLTGFLLAKKVNASVALVLVGLLLMLVSVPLGHAGSASMDPPETGNAWLDQFGYVSEIFADKAAKTGMIIMVLFGFTSYMTEIGANAVTVKLLTKPLLKLGPKGRYALVPLTFWVGNLMSLVVPSASSLAVLLMATLFPTLIAAGISRMAAAAVIATTATIMPTPLGADNVVAAEKLGVDLNTYTWGMHAKISIPTLIIIGIVHYVWQRFCDKRDLAKTEARELAAVGAGAQGGGAAGTSAGASGSAGGWMGASDADAGVRQAPAFYCIFPLLPLVLVLVPWILEKTGGPAISLSLVPVVLISLVVAMITECIVGGFKGRTPVDVMNDAKVFFKGMGDGMTSVVGLLIGAGVLVEGITKLGVIDTLVRWASDMPGGTWIVIFAFVIMMLILTILTGGVAPFYSFAEAVPGVASGLAINGAWLTLPLQFVGNLMRACSPVAAVVLIVSGSVKATPTALIKRTVVPMSVGLVVSLILTWVLI